MRTGRANPIPLDCRIIVHSRARASIGKKLAARLTMRRRMLRTDFHTDKKAGTTEMGYVAAVIFVIAVASAFWGFGEFVDSFEGPARVLFFVSCIMFIIVLVVSKQRNERN